MSNGLGNALISAINRRMFMIGLNSLFGEFYILHTLVSVRFHY